MIVLFDSLHYHIVNINLYVAPNFMGKHITHESLIGGANIIEVEGHDIIVVLSLIQHEDGF